jgi:anti-sigma regulatory factor (Ser/Thr protein kinase)
MPEIPLVPVHWRFPALPASVPQARRAVAEALPKDVLHHLGPDIGLLTSELVTNAIRHGTGAPHEELVELVLWPAEGHYWVAVSDAGTRRTDGSGTPVVTHPCSDSENGRGLLLVDRLAAAWTVRPRAVRGTSVVAGLALRQGV